MAAPFDDITVAMDIPCVKRLDLKMAANIAKSSAQSRHVPCSARVHGRSKWLTEK